MKSVASGGWETGERDGGRWVLGIDVGGTGSRAAFEPLDGPGGSFADHERRTLAGGRVTVASAGSSAPEVAAALIADVRAAWPDARIAGVGIGATGLASLVAAPWGRACLLYTSPSPRDS